MIATNMCSNFGGKWSSPNWVLVQVRIRAIFMTLINDIILQPSRPYILPRCLFPEHKLLPIFLV